MIDKLTPKQIEENMDLGVDIELITYVRDYFAQFYKVDMPTINNNFTNIMNRLEGTDKALGGVGQNLETAATDYVDTPQHKLKAGDWYFNTTDAAIKVYSKKADGTFEWRIAVPFADIIPTDKFMEIQELYDTFLAGQYGKLHDIYTLETGGKVEDSNLKVLNLDEITELIKDQREIDANTLIKFADELIMKSTDEVEYRDTKADLVAVGAQISTSGTTVTYKSLIHPYDRINQEQASFQATIMKDMTVDYFLTSRYTTLRFKGNPFSQYKWETVGKFENGKRVPYVRFSGTCELEISKNPSDPTSFVKQTLPVDIKLSDLMDETHRDAIVTFKFDRAINIGDVIMDIDYKVPGQYAIDRLSKYAKDISVRVDKLDGPLQVYKYNAIGDAVLLNFQYPHGDRPATMKVGESFLLDIDPSALPSPLNDTTPMVLQDISKASADAATNQASMEIIQYQPNANAIDKANFTYGRRWRYFKLMAKDYYVDLQKQEDFDGKVFWKPIGWKPKPPKEIVEAKNYYESYNWQTRTITLSEPMEPGEYNVEIEWVRKDNGEPIGYLNDIANFTVGGYIPVVSHTVKLKRNLPNMGFGDADSSAGPVYYGSYDVTVRPLFNTDNKITGIEIEDVELFDPYAGATATVMESGQEKDIKWSTTSATLKRALMETIKVKSINKTGTFLKNFDITPDPTLAWVDVGQGHEDDVLGFEPSGKRTFKKYFGKDQADVLYEVKTYNYSDTQQTVNLNVTGGKRFLIITQPADAPTTPVNGKNKLWLAHPASPQDGDQVTYGSDLVWIVKANGDIMSWGEIKDHVLKDDKMIIKHLDSGNWELVDWELNVEKIDIVHVYNAIDEEETARVKDNDEIWKRLDGIATKKDIPFFGEFATEALLKAATGMVKDQIAYEEANDIWWHYDGTNWVHHVDSGGSGGTAGDTNIHIDSTKVAIGANAGKTSQNRNANAVGHHAGNDHQGEGASAFGSSAGSTRQGLLASAFGYSAGGIRQGQRAIAIGDSAGFSGQGDYAIAIGSHAGNQNQPPKSIVINANNSEAKATASNEIILSAGTTTVKIDATGIYINGTKVSV